MTVSLMFRRTAAALLVAVLGFAALPGCGSKPGPSQAAKNDPKADPKADPKKVDPGADPKKADPTPPPPTALSKVEPDAEKTAEAFLKSLGEGTATADSLSTGLLKSAGKPVDPLPDDLKNGFSRGNATRWLKRVGEGRAFSLSLDRQQAGDAVYCRGGLQGQPGAYSLRLVKEGGAWKVDWLSLTSAAAPDKLTGGSPDAAFQEFAAAAFAEVLTDARAMSDDTRAAALARALTPELRKAWAAPGKQDADQGYDYSPGNLRLAAIRYGGGTSAFGVAKAGELTYTVTLTKPTGPKTITVKLVKGATPGEWLVSEVTEAKG